jgi:hypothetical protein
LGLAIWKSLENRRLINPAQQRYLYYLRQDISIICDKICVLFATLKQLAGRWFEK